MISRLPLKLTPWLLALLLGVGGFFYGVSVGIKNQKVVYQEKIIEAGARHVEIEEKQSKYVATRGQRLHLDELRKGTF
jgi:hypothetical protein